MRVGVKFCGNCNPQVDLPGVFRELKALAGEIEFVSYSDPAGYDKLLILNSCQANCATRPSFNGTTVIVTGQEIDYLPVPIAELPTTIIKTLFKK